MFAASKSGSVAEATDAQFNYVTMLLHGDGTNGTQNNTFLDSSTNNFTITRNGNTTQGTFTPYGSNWSNYLNGSSSLSVNVSGVAAGTSTFTFEAWVYLNGYPASDAPFYDTRSSNGATTTAMQFGVYSTGALKFYDGTETNLGGTVPLNQWVHIALVRNGSNVMTPYINGTATGTTVSSTRNFSDQYFWIGSVPGPASPYINAYLSNLRWVVGTAVYTSNFTPSTTPLTAITNTKILTCQSNRFIDNSTNAFAITTSGSPSVQRFSPFSPTTAYSTSVIGGSGYFDGSGDYLSVSNSGLFGSGDWSIEFWVNAPVGQTDKPIIDARNSAGGSGSTTGFTIGMISSTEIRVWSNGEKIRATANYVNQWLHFALVKSGSTTTMYFNGVSVGTTTAIGTMSDTSFLVGGGYYGSTSINAYGNFYTSNMRVVKGSAVYTSNFTPPTAPVTAISSTALLMDYTNAGILDNAMMNDLETVGNAQISTSVKKYGTGSMSFDGNGDYLFAPSSPNMILSSGDWTLEAWVYINSLSASQTIICVHGGTFGINWWVNTSGQLVVDDGQTGQSAFTSASISATTWTHVALTRSGTTTRGFVNGVLAGSNTFTPQTCSILLVGRFTSGTTPQYFNGYIDDLRITKGVARYTANFTAPTTAFADKG